MTFTKGIFSDITITDYHDDKEWFSASGLKMAKKSLKLWDMFMKGKITFERKQAFDFGNAFELALLQPDEFNNKVAVEDEILIQIQSNNPDVKSPRSTSMYRDWLDSNIKLQKYILKESGSESFETIQFMLESCKSDAVINILIQNIEYNYSIFWVDSESGLQLKTRPDICKSKKNIIVNLKTAEDGSPEKFFKDCANYDYPFQACMEIEGVLKSGMMSQVDNYFWLVCEKKPPYSATIYEFAHDDREWCTAELHYVLHNVRLAVDANLFPSYSQRADNKHGIITVQLPLWYKNSGL